MRHWTGVRVALVTLLLVVCQATWTLAGTTGSISGVVTDNNGNPVAGATVTVTSASQRAHRTTDAKGFYSILDLSPDTYTVTVEKDGYDTASTAGITVQADQNTTANATVQRTTKVLGRIVTTAQASVVNKSVTGDLYSVNATAIQNYQGASGGSESLFSQNAIVGSLPGVVHQIGIGGGYQQGQGSISLRGGAFDQVGFELEGVPLNRGFDFYNGTPFVSNGLASLEVYTGGAPADSGRAMSGYINEVIKRGSYPGDAHLNFTFGAPGFNNTFNMDWSGATPSRKFSWFVSTLSMYGAYNYGDRNDLDNYTFTIPANDPGCPAYNATISANGGGPPGNLNCAIANTVNAPISVGTWLPQGSPINPSANVYDTVANLHYTIEHNGLADDLQILYNVGASYNPFKYSGASIDPVIPSFSEFNAVNGSGQIIWPFGWIYQGPVGAAYQPLSNAFLFWPGSNNSNGLISPSYIDNQWSQHSIEKLSYTRALTPTSFLRIFGYGLYSAWNLDQATNGVLGGEFYQLHDNATGLTLNYQNQLNQSNLLTVDADYSKDLTLRYNYVNWLPFDQSGRPGHNFNFHFDGPWADCNPGAPSAWTGTPCTSGSAGPAVTNIATPYAYWSSTTPYTADFVVTDKYKPNEKLLFDLGIRFDNFRFGLMPLTINGPNGLAEEAQNQFGQCLFGYKYAANEPCGGPDRVGGGILAAEAAAWGNPALAAGMANWQDVSGSLNFNEFSPRFGVTFTPNPEDVFRLSIGRYVQPPNSAFQEYRGAPQFGPAATVAVLNRAYNNAGGVTRSFLAVHNIQPEDSTNFDFSWEHNFTGGWSAKATPYYRTTRGQIINVPLNIASPTFVTGDNFGQARISGFEFLLSKARLNPELGWSGSVAATYTDSKIKFTKIGGSSYITFVNGIIKQYNTDHSTSYATLDENGYYPLSFSIAPTLTTPSWDVQWVVNINADYKWQSWDFVPTLLYQSGNPYGDPLLFPDVSGTDPFGPDPYTKRFDPLGAFKGPSFWVVNLALSREILPNTKITALVSNAWSSVHNQGYPWEYPTYKRAIAYSDNAFYQVGALAAASNAYIGSDYWAYGPNALLPTPEFTVTVSQKLW